MAVRCLSACCQGFERSSTRNVTCVIIIQPLHHAGNEGTGPVDFEDPSLDYEQLAIHIMVKFRRDEPLQLLTGQRQSGGERAVSTILYLIAIQVLSWHSSHCMWAGQSCLAGYAAFWGRGLCPPHCESSSWG